MSRRFIPLSLAIFISLLCLHPVLASAVTHTSRPKVRAITAFIKIDRANFKTQIAGTVAMLRSAKAEFEKSGFEVQSIRITSQPFPEYITGLSHAEALAFFRDYDALAVKEGVDLNIGPAVMNESDDHSMFDLLGEILSQSKTLEASAIVAGGDGIHWKSVRAAAKLVKHLEENSPRSQGNFNFAATAMLQPFTPFYPGSYHTSEGKKFAVGLQSANVVSEVLKETAGDPKAASSRLKVELTLHASAAESVARRIEKQSGWEYLGIDPTPAPLKDVSIGAAIENFTGQRFGSSGTLSAAYLITDAVKSIPVKQTGYSGLMLPVLEDARIAQRWSEGAVSPDALLAYSSVCATGLDTVPLPGDITEEQLARIIGDVASLAYKWKKPLTARLQPVKGRKAGQKSDFDDPFLVNAVLQKLP